MAKIKGQEGVMPLSAEEIENKLFDISDLIQELEPVLKKARPKGVHVKIRFPRGVIRKAETYRTNLPIITDRTLKTNIAYTLQFGNVYNWIIRWFDVDLTAKQMLIKHGIVLFTSVSEAIVHYFVDNYLENENVHSKYKKNLEKLKSNGVIDEEQHKDFDRCRKIRAKIHLQIQFVREWQEYEENDFYFASGCMSSMNKILTKYVRER